MNIVLRTNPVHRAEKVPVDIILEVYFKIDINVDTLSPQTIVLLNVDAQKGEPFSYEYRNKVLLIQPAAKLSPLAHYQVELVGGEEGLKDIMGRLLDQSFMMEFYTADIKDIKPPVVTAPSHLSSVANPVTFKWNAAERAYFYELEISRSNTFDVLVWPRGDSRVYGTEVTPETALEEGSYYARIRSVNDAGTRSAYSSIIQIHVRPPVTAQSTDTAGTGANAQDELDHLKDQLGGTPEQGLDTLGIASMTPADQEVNVPLSFGITSSPLSEIVLEFDEDLDLSTVDSKSFYVIAQKN
ncbi:Ig-like domain-containing protein [Paenibacillus sp. UNC496MF]|uniref:Ig-like domain-containing protein n=1 Tax=Paenibacillus sp. UNC496MF TaxID=1502753 RepID=UPI0008F40597|nr:Ig-like domain-containing protein [Paenibacillus sp. UNC496MF]SFJ62199.1 Ig-like domain-containing protein [Paenibacillus sp. UNC496MF]